MARCVLFPHYPNYNEQIKGPEFISSVLFAFGICCCQLSRWDPKSCHYQWSKPSLGWKKQNKPIREIAKTLGVAKTTVWNILKKKERTGELSNTKRPGKDHGKHCGGWPKNSFPGEENTLHNSWPDQEHSPGGRCMCVKVNNQEKTSPEWIQRVHHKM